MNKIKKALLKIPFLTNILDWAKKQSFPGFNGVPIYDVVIFIINELLDDDITTRANSMAFSFFIALFPGLIFLFTLIPLLPESAQLVLDFRQYFHGFVPENVEIYLTEIIDDVVNQPRGGLLSFSLLSSIFFASNGMLSMIKGFDKSDKQGFVKRSWIEDRLVAILLTVLIVMIFFASSLFVVAGDAIIERLDLWLGLNDLAILGFQLLRYIGVFLLIYLSLAVIYRYGPALRKKASLFSVGTTLATILIIIASLGFSYFVSNFGNYNELYGSIGALIVFLLWLNIICFIILIGFELNASIAVNSDILAEQERRNREEEGNV